jgi:hypothetical protein
MWMSARRLRALCLLGFIPGLVAAAVFNVNSTDDVADSTTADGLCKTAGNVCTLRAAIQQANALGGSNRINVPAGVYLLNAALGPLLSDKGTNDLEVIGTGPAGTVMVDGQNAVAVFKLTAGAVVLENLVIQHGFVAIGAGGAGTCGGAGILARGNHTSVTVNFSIIQNNVVDNGSGAGICVDEASFTLERSIVRNNTARQGGSGIRVLLGNNLTQILNSTISGNHSTHPAADGAGIESQSAVNVVNSTISGNSTASGGNGSAYYVVSGTTTFNNVTIADNGAATQLTVSGNAELESTIIGNASERGNCEVFSPGAIVSKGHNLDSGESCGFAAAGDLSNTNPMLGPLQNNGGSTPTHALRTGSPAIDAGSNPDGLVNDQRGPGFARVLGIHPDIGAFEGSILLVNHQGLWWNDPPASESGWGVNFAHQGDTIFATWFTYDSEGKPLWLAAVLTLVSPGVYSGDLFVTTGPSFDSVPFDPANVVETTIGTATVTFLDANHATFSYTFDGVGLPRRLSCRPKSITRQEFGPLPNCVWGGEVNLALAANYQDLWWKSPPGSESGWGINLTHQAT